MQYETKTTQKVFVSERPTYITIEILICKDDTNMILRIHNQNTVTKYH